MAGLALVMALDTDAPARRALTHALRMLEVRAAREVHLVHVTPLDVVADTRAGFAALALDLVEGGIDARLDRVWSHARRGPLLPTLRTFAEELDADAIVVGRPPIIDGARREDALVDALAPFGVFIAGGALSFTLVPRVRRRCAACAALRSAALACSAHALAPDAPPPISLREVARARQPVMIAAPSWLH